MVKTIIYIKKDKVKSNGSSPIYVKVIYNRKSFTLSTGKSISEERWRETDNLRRLLRQDKEKVLKEYLDLFILKIEKIIRKGLCNFLISKKLLFTVFYQILVFIPQPKKVSLVFKKMKIN